MSAITAWRTDEPCPVCATGLILHDDGSSPVRVRAGWVTDADIRELAAACEPEPAEPIGWPEVAA